LGQELTLENREFGHNARSAMSLCCFSGLHIITHSDLGELTTHGDVYETYTIMTIQASRSADV
jgi:hypothetical protein